MAEPAKRRATYADLEAVPPHLVAEIIDGELITHSHGLVRLSMVRTALSFELRHTLRAPGGRRDGWFILNLPELHLGSQVIVPDICGWRSARVPVLPETHFDIAPDWVCEILSDETVRYDRGRKREIFVQEGVSDLWLLDPHAELLETFTLVSGKYCWTGTYGKGDVVKALPFDAISFPMSALWPLDEPFETSKNS